MLLDRGHTLDPVEVVDCVEINSWGENDQTQVILWRWIESEQDYAVLGWNIYNKRNEEEVDLVSSDNSVTLRVRGVKIKCFNKVIKTRTRLDPEVKDKQKYGSIYRDPRLNIGGFHFE